MKIHPRILIGLGALVLALAAPSGASTAAPIVRPALAPDAASRLQVGSEGWILWETETPVQRLALDSDTLWVGQDALSGCLPDGRHLT